MPSLCKHVFIIDQTTEHLHLCFRVHLKVLSVENEIEVFYFLILQRFTFVCVRDTWFSLKMHVISYSYNMLACSVKSN